MKSQAFLNYWGRILSSAYFIRALNTWTGFRSDAWRWKREGPSLNPRLRWHWLPRVLTMHPGGSWCGFCCWNNLCHPIVDASTAVLSSYTDIRVAHQRHSYVGCGETPPMVAAYRLNEIDDFMTTEKQRVSSSATTYQPPSQQNFHPEDKDHFNGYDRDVR